MRINSQYLTLVLCCSTSRSFYTSAFVPRSHSVSSRLLDRRSFSRHTIVTPNHQPKRLIVQRLPFTIPTINTIRMFNTKDRSIDIKDYTNDNNDGTSIHKNTRIALCQFPVGPNKEENHATASLYLKQAAAKGARLAVLPEIWNSPYATAAFADYAEELPSVPDQGEETWKSNSPSVQLLRDLAREYKMIIVGGSIPERDGDHLYNTCLVFDPTGTLVAKHRKVHLFDIDVPGGIRFKESDTLSPGNTVTAFDGGSDFGMIGIGICYDIRFPEYSLLLAQTYKCNLLIFPGAFNLTTGPAHWELLQRARAVDQQCFVLTASPARILPPPLVDNDKGSSSPYPHYTAWGHSTAISPWGTVLATCEEDEALVLCDLDMDLVKSMRQGIPTSLQKRTDLYRLYGADDTERL